jgi:DNA-binding transcriptional ArsR family regulator
MDDATPPDEVKRTRRVVDTTALQGLAHPLRVQILEQLTHYGPATATQLGSRLNESSGATSYHLRQLERYGFVEEDPERGTGRERWWRRVRGGISINAPELHERDDSREAARLVVNEFHRSRQQRQERWWQTFEEWPREWQEASGEGSINLRLTADEMCELSQEIDALLERWRHRAGDRDYGGEGVNAVEVQLSLFPLPRPDGTIPSGG